jgi:hypothetical protein
LSVWLFLSINILLVIPQKDNGVITSGDI